MKSMQGRAGKCQVSHFSKTHMPSSIVEYDIKWGEDVTNNTRAACIGHLNLFLQICRRGLGPRPHRTAGCDLILKNAAMESLVRTL